VQYPLSRKQLSVDRINYNKNYLFGAETNKKTKEKTTKRKKSITTQANEPIT